jgi:hypothetical protein
MMMMMMANLLWSEAICEVKFFFSEPLFRRSLFEPSSIFQINKKNIEFNVAITGMINFNETT